MLDLRNNCKFVRVNSREETEKWITSAESKGAETFHFQFVGVESRALVERRLYCVWPMGIPGNGMISDTGIDGESILLSPSQLAELREARQRGEIHTVPIPEKAAQQYWEDEAFIDDLHRAMNKVF